VALERRVDSEVETPGCGNVELLTDVKLPGDSVLDDRDIEVTLGTAEELDDSTDVILTVALVNIVRDADDE